MSMLTRQKAIADLASICADLLPYSGNAAWTNHVSVQSICAELGVQHWQPGSKVPGLTRLFDQLERSDAGRFHKLIVKIMEAGIVYRTKKDAPIQPQEVDQLNDAIERLGYKIPELWDPAFRQGLQDDIGGVSQKRVENLGKRVEFEKQLKAEQSNRLLSLRDRLSELHKAAERHKAGFELEKILNELFEISGLKPTAPFRVVGEQIDGAFELDSESYLIEAKWEKVPLSEKELLVFRGKVEGKSTMTRGLFVSLSGYSKECKEAIRIGKQPNFFAMNGYDLMMILSEDIECADFLRARRSLLAEKGDMFASYVEARARAFM